MQGFMILHKFAQPLIRQGRGQYLQLREEPSLVLNPGSLALAVEPGLQFSTHIQK